MSPEPTSCDLLVIGGGMAGMTAAGTAARRGAEVLVVEKGPAIGGSAALTAGGLLKPVSVDAFLAVNPGGDPGLATLLVDHYDEVIEWMTSLGVTMSEAVVNDQRGYPTSFRKHDVVGYLERCRTVVTEAGGSVQTGTWASELLHDGGTVVGAVVERTDGPAREVHAAWTLLATGGFQASAELRRLHLGEPGVEMIVRSNPHSVGDGLRMATALGAASSEHMDRYYGHVVPWPLARAFGPADYERLTDHFFNTHGLLLDHRGDRFTDESIGYYRNSQMLLGQPNRRALLVGDQPLRDAERNQRGGAGAGWDRVEEAAKAGGHVAEAETLAELEALVAPWGYVGLKAAVEQFAEEVLTDDGRLDPPRRRNRAPLVTPPFFAIEVQPTITSTWGGITVDREAHVLRADGEPIPGLLAAGGDIGGAFHEAYGGGLGLACVLGMQAARVAVADRA